MYDKIARWYKQGLWTAQMVQAAARKGVISPEQAALIAAQT